MPSAGTRRTEGGGGTDGWTQPWSRPLQGRPCAGAWAGRGRGGAWHPGLTWPVAHVCDPGLSESVGEAVLGAQPSGLGRGHLRSGGSRGLSLRHHDLHLAGACSGCVAQGQKDQGDHRGQARPHWHE